MNAPHDWQAPPAGAGTLHVCAKCGERRKPAVEHEPCLGTDTREPAEMKTDYDPFA